MWLESEKELIQNRFSFLKEYGFKIDFFSMERRIATLSQLVIICAIHNDVEFLIIKGYRNYPLEWLAFYKLKSLDEINDIFSPNTKTEIPVYSMDDDLWNEVKGKFLSYRDSIDIVSKSIKRQIDKNNSFYGFSSLNSSQQY